MVAFARAVENDRDERTRLFCDPFAKHFLSPALRLACQLAQAPPLRSAILAIADRLVRGGFGYAVGRTAFIDTALGEALDEGIDQVVILGAGYDCRAYRLPELARATTFEVDHPDTQVRKREVIEELEGCSTAHVRFVAIDFDRESLARKMAESGFVAGARNFFIWEGVTQYLQPESVDATLHFLVHASSPESLVAFTYADRGLVLGTKHFAASGHLLGAARRIGEPFRFGIEPADLAAFLEARGLELVEDLAGAGLVERFFVPRGRRVLASEYEHAALARVRR